MTDRKSDAVEIVWLPAVRGRHHAVFFAPNTVKAMRKALETHFSTKELARIRRLKDQGIFDPGPPKW